MLCRLSVLAATGHPDPLRTRGLTPAKTVGVDDRLGKGVRRFPCQVRADANLAMT